MTTLGTRYPTLAFISGGVGEAEDGIPPQPFETFCYDSALMQAKIENFNIIPYTSVLPKELYNNIVPVDSVASSFKHGAVLEVCLLYTSFLNRGSTAALRISTNTLPTTKRTATISA